MKRLVLGVLGLLLISPIYAQDLSASLPELIPLRDCYSSTYALPNGQKQTVISAAARHYMTDNGWEPISARLTPSKRTGIVAENTTNLLVSRFPTHRSTETNIELGFNGAQVLIASSKRYIRANAHGEISFSFEASSAKKYNELTDSTLSYPSGITGVNDRYTVLPGMLKNDVLVEQRPENAWLSDHYYGFEESIVLPMGWSITPENEQTSSLITGRLFIKDDQGIIQAALPAPIAYDDAGDDGGNYTLGYYMLTHEGNTWRLATLVNSDWLSAPERSYPVSIDPTVVLAGADGGWMSAVNWVNNPAFVFIGVCCGNQEHRAWLQFNTTSINDNACVTDVQLQIYINGVGTAISELTHAYDMTGTPGPYPAISAAVLSDMVSGWYTSFTLSGVGTYGYYDLGTWADAVLQSQLPINWYQVALVFDNEPSVNWKRLTANLCNLSVTYLDPPCSLLPTELTSFSATCKDAHATLQWETASERNNSHFTVMKSSNGIDFKAVAEVTGAGNSEQPIHYTWSDPAFSTESGYYFLTQTDFDGSISTSNIVSAAPCFEGTWVNYSAGMLTISSPAIHSIALVDRSGKTLLRRKNTDNSTTMVVPIVLSPGIYLVELTHVSGSISVERVFVE